MPRAHVYKVLQNGDGSVLTGASVRVLADGASTNLSDPLFTTDAGSGVLTNPFTSSNGKIEFYLDNPQRLQIGVTPPGSGEFFLTVDANPDALYQVISAVPRLSLGTPASGGYMHVNSSGQIEYVSVSPGGFDASVDPIIIGAGASATDNGLALNAIVIGSGAVATGVSGGDTDQTILIGSGATSNDINNVGIGSPVSVTGNSVVAIGHVASANSAGTALGAETVAAAGGVAVGFGATAQGTGSDQIAIGSNAGASADNALAIGVFASSGGSSAVAIGDGAAATSAHSVALGQATQALAASATVIGQAAYSAHTRATALGVGATTTADNQVMLGTSTETVVVPGTLALHGEATNVVATAGATQTLPDTTVATLHYLGLSAASCALTFPTPVTGASFSLFLAQDAIGSRAVTWPGTVKWAGGTAPTLTTTASKTDAFSFACPDGTSWYGFVAGQAFA